MKISALDVCQAAVKLPRIGLAVSAFAVRRVYVSLRHGCRVEILKTVILRQVGIPKIINCTANQVVSSFQVDYM